MPTSSRIAASMCYVRLKLNPVNRFSLATHPLQGRAGLLAVLIHCWRSRASRARPTPRAVQTSQSAGRPNAAPVRALSREQRELMIAANNSYLLAFDNLSRLPHLAL